jgi:PAS domain S-box-containing protein
MEDKKKTKTKSIQKSPDLGRKEWAASKRPSRKVHRRGAGEEKIADQPIEISKHRLKELREQVALSKDPLLTQALEELSTSLEELSVSEEELHQQFEELAAAHQEIEVQRQRYQDLFNFSPDGYLVTSPEGIIKEANRAAALLLGVPQEFLPGKPFRVFIKDRRTFGHLINQLKKIEKGTTAEWEGLLSARKKPAFWAWILISPIHNNHGKLISLSWLFRDVTERKKMEEATRETKKQLRLLASKLITTQENERKRIALDVHDSLGSSLAAIKYKAEDALFNITKGKAMNEYKPLESIIAMVLEIIKDTRRIQTNLRPPHLDDLGIIGTFSWFCREFQTIYSDIRVDQVIAVQESEIPNPLKGVIFRIAQEAMNNIAKHARADNVCLKLQKIDNTIDLIIQDNGKGFNLKGLNRRKSFRKGLGLSSMRERAEISGGSLSLESKVGKGTVIKSSWCLPDFE